MFFYLFIALGLNAVAGLNNDCWNDKLVIDDGENEYNIESFEACYEFCKQELGDNCHIVEYRPAVKVCYYSGLGAQLYEQGFVFSTRECSSRPVGDRAACREYHTATAYNPEAYERSTGTRDDCDDFCLQYPWCQGNKWWPGSSGTVNAATNGYCSLTDSPIMVKYYGATVECLEAEPEEPSASLKPKKDKVSCKAGKRCKIFFNLSVPEGVRVRRRRLKVCKLVGGKRRSCVSAKHRKGVVSKTLSRRASPSVAGDYVCVVRLASEKLVSDPVSVSVE